MCVKLTHFCNAQDSIKSFKSSIIRNFSIEMNTVDLIYEQYTSKPIVLKKRA